MRGNIFFVLLWPAALALSMDTLTWSRSWARAQPPVMQQLSGPDEDAPDSADQTALFAALRSRQTELEREQQQLAQQWRSAKCESKVRLALDDWIRRLALDWPLVAVGTARGSVVISDLLSGQVVGRALAAHPSRTDETDPQMRLLHGEYDGGGLLAIAFSGGRVASAGREGGAQLWRFGAGLEDRDELLPDGVIPVGSLCSSLCFADGDVLWAASLDGAVSSWALPSSHPSKASTASPTAVPTKTLSLKTAAAAL